MTFSQQETKIARLGGAMNSRILQLGGVLVLGISLFRCSTSSDSTSYSTLSDVTALAAADYHVCALLSSGAVKCWGSNTKGEVGASSGTTCERGGNQEGCEMIARQVTGLTSGVTEISVGKNHNCAIQSGAVKCWGNNANGQLGNNSTVNSTSPVSTTSTSIGTSVTSIAAGEAHSCAVTGGGGVYCWGSNGSGELGNGSNTQSSVPVAVSGLGSGVSQAAAGSFYSCARLSDSSAQCWGGGGDGQLGNNSTSNQNTPVQVNGLTAGVSEIRTGVSLAMYFACARVFTSLQCWGKNLYGNLGNNSQTNSSVPVNVSGISSGVSNLTVGAYHACAVVSGALKCWGSNSAGVLGATTGNLTVSGTSSPASAVPVDATAISGTITQVVAGTDFTCALLSDKTVRCVGGNSYGSLGNNSVQSSATPVTVLTE